MKNLSLFFLLVLLIIGCSCISVTGDIVYNQLSQPSSPSSSPSPTPSPSPLVTPSPSLLAPSSPSLLAFSSPSLLAPSSPSLLAFSSPSPSLLAPSSPSSFTSPSSSLSSPLSPSPSPNPSSTSSPSSLPSSSSSFSPLPPQIVSNVLDYGAIGDGIVVDTEAFKEAWNDACHSQDGNLLVPSGYSFLVGPTIFEGPCNGETLFLLEGEILAPKSPDEWQDKDDHPKWLKFEGLSNLIVKGQGGFNGRGQDWWSCKEEGSCERAPSAVIFDKCEYCAISGVTFVDSQQIHFEFQHSNYGLVDSITILAPGDSPNTDGIHIKNSSFIDVQNSFVKTGDDCVSIVSGCHHINVTNMYCGTRCHGISIGSLGKDGAEAEVSNVDVKNCTLEDTTNGLRIKSWPGGHGYAQNITYSDITMKNVENPIIIDQDYCPHVQGECEKSSNGVKVRNIVYNNIIGTSASEEAITFDCTENVPCEGITLNNVQLKHFESGKKTISQCMSAHGVATQSSEPLSCLIW